MGTFWGGQQGTFFDPVFNFADACVSVGIISMLLFCRKELEQLGGNDKKKGEKKETSTQADKKETSVNKKGSKEDNKEDKK